MKHTFFLLAVFFLTHANAQINYKTYNFSVDFSENGKPHEIYWNATGFTPGEILFRKDMQLTLDYMSALPNQGYLYIRPHWMLNLIGSREAGTKNAVYNFERLGEAFDVLIERDLKPVFEIMGFPSMAWEVGQVEYDANAQSQKGQAQQWIPDFEQKEEALLWHDFVKEMILFLEKRYGEEELKTWFFESTNEPDVTQHFWSLGIPALLNYWDATNEAIKSVNPAYRVGGPATAKGLSDEFKQFLAHCDTGTNIITGKQGSELDFISIHRKFVPYEMIDKELELVEYIRENHPRFKDLPFWNDEADPMAGWSRSYWWRPHSWYAAFVAQSVDAHNRLLIDSAGVNFTTLLNDNGFLGHWYQRSQMARFIDDNDQERQSNFWLIKKPVFTVMTLLALSEGMRYDVKGYETTREQVVMIPSKTKNGEIVLLLVNKPEFGPVHNNWVNNENITLEQKKLHHANGASVTVSLEGLDFENPVLKHVKLDGLHGYAHGAWKSLGAPDTLTRDLYKMVASHMEPVLVEDRPLEHTKLHVSLPPSSVSMFIISEKDSESTVFTEPDITRITDYTGYNGEKKKFIRWEQTEGKIVRYNVLASYNGYSYQAVNPAPVFDPGFLHVLPDGVEDVEYKIEVVP
ncbi:MAG: GH39 family glycosyl hydrolase [Bacteroidota bacterium]